MSDEPDEIDRIMRELKRTEHTQQVSDKRLNRIIRKVTGATSIQGLGQKKSALEALDLAMPKKSDGSGNPTVWWVDPEGKSVSNMVAEMESEEAFEALDEATSEDDEEGEA